MVQNSIDKNTCKREKENEINVNNNTIKIKLKVINTTKQNH